MEEMPIDDIIFAPPDDLTFQSLILRATKNQIPVYGVVIQTKYVSFVRAYENHRPENLPGGDDALRHMLQEWQVGKSAQPWLYVEDHKYVVADDYFWLALIEKGKPPTVAAQIFGEPLNDGLLRKVGPLGPDFVKHSLGFM